jgi:hypothetical protein
MAAKLRSRLTFANVMSVIAVFIALGGGAYAVTTAPRNSVVSKSIKNGEVKNGDLGAGAVSGSKIASDPWHVVAANPVGATDPCPTTTGTFCGTTNSQGFWSNSIEPGFETVRFSKDASGYVHLAGLARLNSSNPGFPQDLFILPAGYRPLNRHDFVVDCSFQDNFTDSAQGRIDVTKDGNVTWPSDTDVECETFPHWIALDGITFRAEH